MHSWKVDKKFWQAPPPHLDKIQEELVFFLLRETFPYTTTLWECLPARGTCLIRPPRNRLYNLIQFYANIKNSIDDPLHKGRVAGITICKLNYTYWSMKGGKYLEKENICWWKMKTDRTDRKYFAERCLFDRNKQERPDSRQQDKWIKQ